MATTKFDISDEWVKIVDDGTEFLLETGQFVPVRITYAEVGSPPDSNAPYHLIKGKEAMVRTSLGDVYAMSDSVPTWIVVSPGEVAT